MKELFVIMLSAVFVDNFGKINKPLAQLFIVKGLINESK